MIPVPDVPDQIYQYLPDEEDIADDVELDDLDFDEFEP